jgi:hypothetical protein
VPNYRVHEDHADRSWKGNDKVPDYAMNVVLDILLVRGRQTQDEIARELAATLEMKLSTARAYTSASLLHFRMIEFVRVVDREGELTEGGRRSPVWEAVE